MQSVWLLCRASLRQIVVVQKIVNFLMFLFYDCSHITSIKGELSHCQLQTLSLLSTSQTLSKPLAQQSVRTCRPSFWNVWTNTFKPYCLCIVKKENKNIELTDKVIVFYILFCEIGLFHYHPPIFCGKRRACVIAFGIWCWYELRSCDYYSHCARTHRSRGGHEILNSTWCRS